MEINDLEIYELRYLLEINKDENRIIKIHETILGHKKVTTEDVINYLVAMCLFEKISLFIPEKYPSLENKSRLENLLIMICNRKNKSIAMRALNFLINKKEYSIEDLRKIRYSIRDYSKQKDSSPFWEDIYPQVSKAIIAHRDANHDDFSAVASYVNDEVISMNALNTLIAQSDMMTSDKADLAYGDFERITRIVTLTPHKVVALSAFGFLLNHKKRAAETSSVGMSWIRNHFASIVKSCRHKDISFSALRNLASDDDTEKRRLIEIVSYNYSEDNNDIAFEALNILLTLPSLKMDDLWYIVSFSCHLKDSSAVKQKVNEIIKKTEVKLAEFRFQ